MPSSSTRNNRRLGRQRGPSDIARANLHLARTTEPVLARPHDEAQWRLHSRVERLEREMNEVSQENAVLPELFRHTFAEYDAKLAHEKLDAAGRDVEEAKHRAEMAGRKWELAKLDAEQTHRDAMRALRRWKVEQCNASEADENLLYAWEELEAARERTGTTEENIRD